MSAWQVLGSWVAVLVVAALVAVSGVAVLRRGAGTRPGRAVGGFLAVWFVLSGGLAAFLLASASVGDVTCSGTTVDATHEVRTGDLGSTDDPVFARCRDKARARYVVGLLVYVGLAGAGVAAVRRVARPSVERPRTRSGVR